MHFIKEPVVERTSTDNLAGLPLRRQWSLYKITHQLAADFYKIKRNRGSELLSWLIDNSTNCSSLSIDSFSPVLSKYFNVDCYEFVHQKRVFANLPNISYMSDVSSISKQYQQIFILGQFTFKYKTTEQYAQLVCQYAKFLLNQGQMFLCLPMMHHCFHRLKHQELEIIDLINEKITADDLAVQKFIKINQCFYLKIVHRNNFTAINSF